MASKIVTFTLNGRETEVIGEAAHHAGESPAREAWLHRHQVWLLRRQLRVVHRHRQRRTGAFVHPARRRGGRPERSNARRDHPTRRACIRSSKPSTKTLPCNAVFAHLAC